MSGVSKSPWLAMLMRTPRPVAAPAHSATTAPMTASVTPTRSPPKMTGSAEGISSRRVRCAGPAPEAAQHLVEQRVGGADADHGGDGDREEDDQRADHDPRQQPAAEPDVEQRRQGQDRAPPGRRRCTATGRARSSSDLAERDARSATAVRGTDRESEHDLEQRHRGVLPQHAGADGARRRARPRPPAPAGCTPGSRRRRSRASRRAGRRRGWRSGSADAPHAAPSVSAHGRSSSARTDASAARTSAGQLGGAPDRRAARPAAVAEGRRRRPAPPAPAAGS